MKTSNDAKTSSARVARRAMWAGGALMMLSVLGIGGAVGWWLGVVLLGAGVGYGMAVV